MFHDSWPNRPLTAKERVGHNDGGLKFAALKTRSTRGLWSAFQSFAKAAKAHRPVSATEPPRSRQPDLLQAWACSLPTRTLETLMNYIIYHHIIIIITSNIIKLPHSARESSESLSLKFWVMEIRPRVVHLDPTALRRSTNTLNTCDSFGRTRSWPWPAPSMRHHLATQKNFCKLKILEW